MLRLSLSVTGKFNMDDPIAQILPLESLHANEQGRIRDIVGPDAWIHRLRELGLSDGTVLKLVKPGQPCIVALNGHRLSLRLETGTMILVEIVP